jgi:hypothetical protein
MGALPAPAGGGRVVTPEQLFDELAADFVARPGVHLGKMMSSSRVLSVNGKIFAMLVRERLVVKLPAAQAAELIHAGAGGAFEPRPGRAMKQWVTISPDSGATTWATLADNAQSYVAGLPAPARRRRPLTSQ